SVASATLPTTDRALGRSRVSDSRIKRRPHAGLPRMVDRSRIKWQPHAEKAAEAATSHANGSSCIPTTVSQWPATRSRALAAAQAASTAEGKN
ncbi:hypothetical protein B296_00048149, partial [Ensete ventricosum]